MRKTIALIAIALLTAGAVVAQPKKSRVQQTQQTQGTNNILNLLLGGGQTTTTQQAKPQSKPQPSPQTQPKAPAGTPGVRREEPAHPKAVRYTEVSDEDFFGKFDPPKRAEGKKSIEDGPLTLDDIFGDDGMFSDDRKGGKR